MFQWNILGEIYNGEKMLWKNINDTKMECNLFYISYYKDMPFFYLWFNELFPKVSSIINSAVDFILEIYPGKIFWESFHEYIDIFAFIC